MTAQMENKIAAGSDPTAINNEGKKPSDITSSPTIKKILVGNYVVRCCCHSDISH